MKWPLVFRRSHERELKHVNADRERLRGERNQFAEDRDRYKAKLERQVEHHRDEHPDGPVPIQPASGDARTRHLLALSERARRSLDEQLLTLHWTTVQQEREILQLQQQLTALQAAAEGVAS